MNTKTSMYKFNEKAFVTLPKSEKVYILSQKGYE